MGLTTLESSLLAIGLFASTAGARKVLLMPFQEIITSKAENASVSLRNDFLFFSGGNLVATSCAIGGILASLVFLISGSLVFSLVSMIGTPIITKSTLTFLRERRRRRIVAQLPGFVDLLCGTMKSGHSLAEGLNETRRLLPKELRQEMDWLCHTLRLGTPIPKGLQAWERRCPLEEISLIVRPLSIAYATGGNTIELLEQCRDILKARKRSNDRLHSLTAQGRMQAVVLSLLPPGFILILDRIMPGFLGQMTTTQAGKIVLATSIFLQVLGWLSIRKIMSVKP